jgi:hypothetical protein
MAFTRVEVGFGLTVDQVTPQTQGDAGNISDNSGGSSDLVLVFRTRKDGKVRPEHAALEGRTWDLLDPDAPNPPLAPGCRCEVVIEDRKKAARQTTVSTKESLEKFAYFERNLAQVYPADVVEAYRSHLLPADVIIQRTGDRITTAQARAIIASRKDGADPKYALSAIAKLADQGLSGRILNTIVEDARLRIAAGAAPKEAAASALRATPQRGTVTGATITKTADSLVQSRLLDGIDPAPTKVFTSAIPKPTQSAQADHEGQPLRKPTAALLWGDPKPAPKAPQYIEDAERQIARRTTERLLAWDESGMLVGSSEGTTNSASVPNGIPAGARVTHNHPSAQKFAVNSSRAWGTSLSPADLRCARSGNWLSIRSVTPSGLVAEMTRPAGGWPSSGTLNAIIAEADNEVQSLLSSKISAGTLSVDDAEAMHANLVNQRVASRINATYQWGVHE